MAGVFGCSGKMGYRYVRLFILTMNFIEMFQGFE